MWKPIEGYKYIGIKEGVCGGEPTIIGTRIEPRFITAYGTIEEAMEDFKLTKEQVEEAIKFAYCEIEKMKEYRDCLSCGHSFSKQGENGEDKLYCTLYEKYVNEEDCCEDYD